MRVFPVIAIAVVCAGLCTTSATAAPSPSPAPPGSSSNDTDHVTLYDGTTATLGPDGFGLRTAPRGGGQTPFAMVRSQGRTALGDMPGPDAATLAARLSAPQRSGPTGQIVVQFASARVDGPSLGHGRYAARTTDSNINAALHRIGAEAVEPLTGTAAAGLAHTYLLQVAQDSAAQDAALLQTTSGVSYAGADQYVSAMDTDPVPMPAWVGSQAPHRQATLAPGTLPSNFGLQSSLQSYLNANGVDLVGGYHDITSHLHQLPGTGEIITNVSLGDLTDQSMAAAGDGYVAYYGPTTVVQGGQRYLDYPSLPLIPTYTVDTAGTVNPLGTVEGVDPHLGEVLLDFSMMAPLPHDQQRPGELGAGPTDLLGIAPGAQYRLVEPAQPTAANIAAALLAAANQSPHPDVITASLGFGTDSVGFPGRYLEDDPLIREVISTIVARGIVVTLSANDGTRLYTPAAVGPDGGSTPTDLAAAHQSPTTLSDDATSTTPSVVPDSGAIDVGGTTTDDTIGVPALAGGALAATPTFAETRLNGMTGFSSGFGSRVNVSAPSDNIPALQHTCLQFGRCTPSDAVASLEGGTSASAPMTAAAVADLLQVGRETGHRLTPAAVRKVLEDTGRSVPTQPQVDRALDVGPQIDITRAVESLLDATGAPDPSILRVSVAHRVSIRNAGADFVEAANPSAIDLSGPDDVLGSPTGEALVGPLTFGLDLSEAPQGQGVSYTLIAGAHAFTSEQPAIRVTPTQLLTAFGQPVASPEPRTLAVTLQVRRGATVLAQTTQSLTLGPTDGTHAMAPAPAVAPVSPLGAPVPVRYDLTGVRGLHAPQLIISSVGHWSPYSAPLYRIEYAAALPSTTGVVDIPASVFAAGAGIYGATILQDSVRRIGGVAVAFRIGEATSAQRPEAPTLTGSSASLGHAATLTRATPKLRVRWDVNSVPGATGAQLEISAPGPTIYGLLNTFTNQFGGQRDANGTDSPSTALLDLPATSGTTQLDLLALHIPTSLTYQVRVLATRHGVVTGEASPSASLEFDDGLIPNGGRISNFDINPNGPTTVGSATLDSTGVPTSSTLSSYDPSTGQYGPTLASDPTGNNVYFVYGRDPGANRIAAATYPWAGTRQHLLTYDSTSGQQTSDLPVDINTDFNIIAGRVDPARHRTDLLGWNGSTQADEVVPMDTRTGRLGTPVAADNGTPGRHFYTMIDVQHASGTVDLAGSLSGDLCVIRRSGFTTVDMNAGTAAPMTAANRCLTGLVSDQSGHADLTVGPLYSYPMLPTARLQQVDESTGTIGPLQGLGAQSPMFPAIDTTNGLLVVGFLAGSDYHVNNNGMSSIGVFDLKTGAPISLREQFNLISAWQGLPGDFGIIQGGRGIQLDPTSRTGWTYSPYGNELQQFSY